jgi:hypothetical protein
MAVFDEAGMRSLRALGLLIAVERVGERDGGHGDEREGFGRHLAQLAIEGLAADEGILHAGSLRGRRWWGPGGAECRHE